MNGIGLPEIQIAFVLILVYVLPFIMFIALIVMLYRAKKKLDAVDKETKRLAANVEDLLKSQNSKQ